MRLLEKSFYWVLDLRLQFRDAPDQLSGSGRALDLLVLQAVASVSSLFPCNSRLGFLTLCNGRVSSLH